MQFPLSPPLAYVSISLFLLTVCLTHSTQKQKTLQSFFCSGQEPVMDRYKPLYPKHYRKLQGNLHTEIQAQHLGGVSLHLGVGSTEMTTLLLALLQVSGKEEKQQRGH